MVLLVINRAANLKRAVKLFWKFVQPGKEACFLFRPEGVSLMASSHDDGIIASVELDRETFRHYRCDRPCSYAFNLDLFQTVVNLASDSESVTILATITAAASSIHLTPHCFGERTFEIQVYQTELDFVPMPKQYTAKVGIPTQIFTSTLNYFANFDNTVTIVGFTVTSDGVEISIKNHKCHLAKQRNECIIEGLTEEQEHVEVFNWKYMVWKPLKKTISKTSRVWIYLSIPDDAPPVLMCPVPSIGNIMYYFYEDE